MRHVSTILSILILATPSFADGLLYTLPKDGTAAHYTFKQTMTFPKKKDDPITMKGEFTLASVGKVKEKGKDCRWIEIVIKSEPKKNIPQTRTIIKALVPEQHIGKGKNPLKHWIRGWAKLTQQNPMQLTKDQLRQPNLLHNMFITGPLKQTKPLKEKVIDTKALGKLKCVGEKGTFILKDGVVNINNGVVTKRDAILTFENHFHEKSPFGVVKGLFRMDGGKDQAKAEAVLMLDRIETKAKSLLPERK